MHHPDRSKQNHASDRGRIVEVLCTELACTDYQQRRVEYMLEEVGNLREFFPTKSMEAIILGAISLAVDAETTDFSNRITARDEFTDLQDDVGLDTSDLWTIRQKLREETTLFDDVSDD